MCPKTACNFKIKLSNDIKSYHSSELFFLMTTLKGYNKCLKMRTDIIVYVNYQLA